MEIQGVWMYNFIQKYNPTLKWQAAPFPYPKDRPDLKGHTIIEQDIFVLLKHCKHREEAIDFLAYLQKQGPMEKLCLGQKKSSPLRVKSAEFWVKSDNPCIHLFDDMAYSKSCFATPKLGIWPEYGAEITNALDEVSLLRKSPEDALKAIDERMQPKLDQYLSRLEKRRKAGK